MDQRDLMFLVMLLIALTTLTVVIVQLVRSRRRKPGEKDPTNWWEGPWDGDRK